MPVLFNKRILNHVLFWLFYALAYTINYTFAPYEDNRQIGDSLYFLPGHMFFTYAQMYWAIPRYLLTKKYITFFIVSLGLLIVGVCYSRFANYFTFRWPGGHYHFFISLIGMGRAAFSFLPVAGLGVSIKLLRNWYQQREKALQAENEKVKIELEMLRSQIHPHFLFNTLNNLYSLTLNSSVTASTVVLHLSDLLRYILYECSGNKVSLGKELEILKKYIELEKIRFGNRLDVAFTITGEVKDLSIAPLLLLPFIENSFKHGVSNEIDQCWINIDVHVRDGSLNFRVINSCANHVNPNIGGVGLQNVRKRLTLLYPGNYELKSTAEAQMYVVQLNMQLSYITPKPAVINKNLPMHYPI